MVRDSGPPATTAAQDLGLLLGWGPGVSMEMDMLLLPPTRRPRLPLIINVTSHGCDGSVTLVFGFGMRGKPYTASGKAGGLNSKIARPSSLKLKGVDVLFFKLEVEPNFSLFFVGVIVIWFHSAGTIPIVDCLRYYTVR